MNFFEAENLMHGLSKVALSMDMVPVRVGLTVAKNKRRLAEAIAPFLEMKEKIVAEYKEPGKTKVEEGDPGYEKAKEKVIQLYAEEVAVDFDQIDVKDIEGLSLPIATITVLSYFTK